MPAKRALHGSRKACASCLRSKRFMRLRRASFFSASPEGGSEKLRFSCSRRRLFSSLFSGRRGRRPLPCTAAALRFQAFLREEGGGRRPTEGARATQEIHLAIGKGIGNALREAYKPCVFCVKYSNNQAPQAPSPGFAGSSLPEGALERASFFSLHHPGEDGTKTNPVFAPAALPQ